MTYLSGIVTLGITFKNNYMSAKEFLTEKGILPEGAETWIIKFEDGREFDLVELFAEYGEDQYNAGSEAQFYGAQ